VKGERSWKAVAVALAAGAVAASLNTGLSAPRHREILARKQGDLQQIQADANRWVREDKLRVRLDAQHAWNPADLDELATRTLGAGVAKITPRPAQPGAGDWCRREATVDLRNVSYAEAARFLAAVAETPPAWRLREIEIQPSAAAGQGAMSLVLEALEKRQP
jgi:hypothetical protein